ncbi:hypothetical protein [Butyrivibrio sp. XPD2002]|nr:hypothetical protein [Butyrivibrio sp. XPD2002]
MPKENKNHDNKTPKNKDMLIGAGALLSVIAVPFTILAGLLLNDRRKNK